MEQIIIETEIGLGDYVETVYGDVGSVEAIALHRNGSKIFLIQIRIGAAYWLHEYQLSRKIPIRETEQLKDTIKFRESINVKSPQIR